MAASRGLAGAIRSRVELPSPPLLVALSGGADSAVLAWMCATGSAPARAVFVDHGLAGSARLRAAAAAIADTLGLDLDVVEAPVARNEPSFEDAARRARYQALEGAAKPEETIVTGHTADDQAETVLGNFLRGAGAAGLAGIPAARGRLARPLLGVTRAEARALASELDLPFFDDPDNAGTDVRRNRLRHELIPRLEADYNPQLRAALARTAEVMAGDDAVLEERASGVPVGSDGEAVWLPDPLLTTLPGPVAARAARRALRNMRGPHAGSREEVQAVLAVAAGERAGAELAGGVRAEREGARLVLSTGDLPPSPAVGIVVPAAAAFDRWVVACETRALPGGPRPLGARRLFLDADAVGLHLVLRAAGPADRIDIGVGTKPVAEAMAEAGVPRRLRSRWPVIMAGRRVAAVPGVRGAAWAWPTPGTSCYLEVRINDRAAAAEGP